MPRASTTGVLTVQQSRIVQFIADYWTAYGYAPAIRDLARQLGRSPSSVAYQLGELEAAGRITRARGISRSVRVVEQP